MEKSQNGCRYFDVFSTFPFTGLVIFPGISGLQRQSVAMFGQVFEYLEPNTQPGKTEADMAILQ
jgi:hypothetical protein